MINVITVCSDGHIIPESDCLGRTGEHNATVLKFDFFEDLNGKSVSDFQKYIVAIFPEGTLRYHVESEFSVPEELTAHSELVILVELENNGEILFKSRPHTFTLTETGDNPEVDVIQNSVTAAKNEFSSELAESLQTATGDEHSDKTWDELKETVAGLPVITEEQSQALGDWDLIKDYFENYRGQTHHLFASSPKYADGSDMLYKLPYIYTPNLQWKDKATMLSTYLLEVGVDVSSAVNLGGSGASRTFSPLPQLQNFVITGNANTPSLAKFMYGNYELRYIKMDTPSEAVLSTNSSYYTYAFYRCERLQTIDCELDFTGQTSLKEMFRNCYEIKNLRIKPFTLTCSLDVRNSRWFVHPEIRDNSMISILNAIPNPETEGENAEITITYSNYAWEFETGADGLFAIEFMSNEIWFDPDTGLYSWDKQTENSVSSDFFEAFSKKGVTISTP